jgi:hypothetical protein
MSDFHTMGIKRLMLAGALVASGCGSPSPPLPPLLEGATAGGGANFLCAPGFADLGEGTTIETVGYSPEIAARLRRDFPPGSPSGALIAALREQGFSLHRCATDPSIGHARFSQSGGNGITAMDAVADIYWKADDEGRLVRTTGNIAFRGL